MAEQFNSIAIPVTQHFLKKLEIPFTNAFVKDKLENDPYYPSLFSISHLLTQYNIENRALEINNEQLNELPPPFFAFLKLDTGDKDFVTITSVSENQVHYFDGLEKTISRNEFLSRWTGVTLLAQSNKESVEKNYEKNKTIENTKKLKSAIIIIGFVLFLLSNTWFFLKEVEFLAAPFLLLIQAIIGLTISVFLLIHEIDDQNLFVKNICTGGSNVNCDAVLNSKASKIFGISWSEIGFFFFSFLFLYLLLPGTSFDEKKNILTYILLFSSAYIPFSITYQLLVVKQWCRLCLGIQFLLITGLVWSIAYGNFTLNFSLSTLFTVTITAGLPILIWYTLKPILIKAQNSGKYLAAYKRLYSHPEVFKVIVAEEPIAPEGWENLGGIEKGNPNAKSVLLKICSPSCGHCNKAHKIFNELLASNENIKIVTLYDVYSNGSINETLEKPVQHFLSLKELGRDEDLKKAMDYWYLTSGRNYETLKKLFPVEQDVLNNQLGKMKAMSDWCQKAEVSYTPTIYINGYKLPSTFQLTDLKYVLP